MARIDEIKLALGALKAARRHILSDVSTDSRTRLGQAKAIAKLDEVIYEYDKVLTVETAVRSLADRARDRQVELGLGPDLSA